MPMKMEKSNPKIPLIRSALPMNDSPLTSFAFGLFALDFFAKGAEVWAWRCFPQEPVYREDILRPTFHSSLPPGEQCLQFSDSFFCLFYLRLRSRTVGRQGRSDVYTAQQ